RQECADQATRRRVDDRLLHVPSSRLLAGSPCCHIFSAELTNGCRGARAIQIPGTATFPRRAGRRRRCPGSAVSAARALPRSAPGGSVPSGRPAGFGRAGIRSAALVPPSKERVAACLELAVLPALPGHSRGVAADGSLLG